AAAARSCAGVGVGARGIVPRRADREPRSRLDARCRDHHRPDTRRRHPDRHDDAQPEPGAAPRRRDRFPEPGQAHRAHAARAILCTTGVEGSRRFHTRRNTMELNRRKFAWFALAALVVSAASPMSWAQKFITVASTTSTEQSGLFKHLLPAFTKKSGIEVRV